MQFDYQINPSTQLFNPKREYDYSPALLPERKTVLQWVPITTPVIGTCRMCGVRDLMDKPVVGLYTDEPRLRFNKATSFCSLDAYDTSPIGTLGRRDRFSPNNVNAWVPVLDSVIGTCRHCGYRGLVHHPVMGVCY